MSLRNQQISGFLASAGWADAHRRPLAGDASARRYDRVVAADGKTCAVLMDAPTDMGEDTQPFLQVCTYLLDQGFAAPRIIASDQTLGLILMEDLGDALYARICTSHPDLEQPVYEAAVDVLTALQTRPAPDFLPPYDQKTYLREAGLLTDWYLPAATGKGSSNDLKAEYDALMAAAVDALEGDQSCCVLRDYHAENLLWMPDRQGVSRVGLLDFQDALCGHPAYDLVSLLEDARRDTPDGLQQAMIARFLDQTGADATPFRQAYATLGAQRNLKIVGIFARLCLRDDKPGYVDLIPRVWAHLMRDLSHPSLTDLQNFVARYVPAPENAILSQIMAAKP